MAVPRKEPPVKNIRKLAKGDKQVYILHLYVAGILENSVHAINNITRICERNLKDNYELKIFDINQQPGLSITEQIIVIPVLILKYPLPERRIIGDMSDTRKILKVLNIKQA